MALTVAEFMSHAEEIGAQVRDLFADPVPPAPIAPVVIEDDAEDVPTEVVDLG